MAHEDAWHASWSQRTSCVPLTGTYCLLLVNSCWVVLSRLFPVHLPDCIPLVLTVYYERANQVVSHRSVVFRFDQYCIVWLFPSLDHRKKFMTAFWWTLRKHVYFGCLKNTKRQLNGWLILKVLSCLDSNVPKTIWGTLIGVRSRRQMKPIGEASRCPETSLGTCPLIIRIRNNFLVLLWHWSPTRHFERLATPLNVSPTRQF